MTRFRELGTCKLFDKNGTAFEAHPKYWEAIQQAFKSSVTIFECTDIYDDPLIVKMNNIEAISLATPAAIALYEQDQATLRAEEVVQ